MGRMAGTKKIHLLTYRADWLADKLTGLNIPFFRAGKSNIITIDANYISEDVAHKYGLVPNTHDGQPDWYKVVVMDHVTIDTMEPLINDLQQTTLV
jgi:tyrosine decarboxylase/aspartate 1-decarboxylase